MLLATTACNFSALIWPDGSAPAALAGLLFDSPEPRCIGKHSDSQLFYLFAHLRLLSSHSFSSLILSLLLFSSLTLPTSAFPSVHIVGSLTSKLPSASTARPTRFAVRQWPQISSWFLMGSRGFPRSTGLLSVVMLNSMF